jgi:small subunit ribosomal protein S20
MDEGHLEEAREAVQVAVRVLDKAAEKGIIHKNNAARRKSRLMRRLNQAERAA